MREYLLKSLFDKENIQDIEVKVNVYKHYKGNLEK